jgi:TRAP-type mannitol/chloroaromatic compound transport system substrate-binding protein
MLQLFRDTWEEVAAEESANDAYFAEVYADLSQFRSNYDLWEENAFLPRF